MRKAIFGVVVALLICVSGCAPTAPSNTDTSTDVSTAPAATPSGGSGSKVDSNVTTGAEVPGGETP